MAETLREFHPEPGERKHLRRAEILSRRARLKRQNYKDGYCTREDLQKSIDRAESQYERMLEKNLVPETVLTAHMHFIGPQARYT